MDREKVKKELLELNAKAYGLWVHDQKNEFLAQIGNVTDDALELLKEQEAKQVYLYGNEEWWGLVCICPDCKAEWMSDKADTHFCPRCGRAVKWE